MKFTFFVFLFALSACASTPKEPQECVEDSTMMRSAKTAGKVAAVTTAGVLFPPVAPAAGLAAAAIMLEPTEHKCPK